MDITQNLKDLGITLPKPAPAAGNYLPIIQEGNLLLLSGQLPFNAEGELVMTGIIGVDRSLEDGIEAARYCCINILAQAANALDGDLSRIKRCIKLGGFVASAPDFTAQPKVINGASDLMVAVLGEAGKHTRIAVGVASLPLNATVEIDAQFIIEPA